MPKFDRPSLRRVNAPAFALGLCLLSFSSIAVSETTATVGSELNAKDREILTLLEEGARAEHGEGTNRDPRAAQLAYCRAIRLGSSEAMISLGWMYANGRGVTRDDAQAASLFRRAAEAGNPMGERLSLMITSSDSRPDPCVAVLADSVRNRSTSAAAQPSTVIKPGSPLSVAVSGNKAINLGAPAEFRKPMSAPEQKQLIGSILKMAVKFQLDPRLVVAIIQHESNFDPNARSPKDAKGLMQLIPETAERFAVTDPLDPLENIRGGMSYLRWLLGYFRGDVSLVLAAYNAGEGAVDKYKGIPPFPETLAYVQRIRALYPIDRHPFDPKASGGRVTSIK